jgi:hypothetical protein
MMRTNQRRHITFRTDPRPAMIATLYRRIDADVITASCSSDPSRRLFLEDRIRQNRALLAATSTAPRADPERINNAARANTRATGERKTGKRKFTEELHKRDAGGKFSKSEGGGRYGGPEKGVSYSKDKKKKGGKGGGGKGVGKGKGGGGKGAAEDGTQSESAKRTEQRRAEAEARRQAAEAERANSEAKRQEEYAQEEADREAEQARDAARVGRYQALQNQTKSAEDALAAHLEQVKLGYESYEAERLGAREAAKQAVGAADELKMLLREAQALNDQERMTSLAEQVKTAEETAKEAMRVAVHLDQQRNVKQAEVKVEQGIASRERTRLNEVLAAQRQADQGERAGEAATKRAQAEVKRRAAEVVRREAVAKAAAERAARAAEQAEDKALREAEAAAKKAAKKK